ncbi:MAG TPA: hypothetical protein VGF40_00925 [Thermoanaerobaculia bacterium]
MRRSFFLLALLLGIPSIAAELVAPRPVILGPPSMNDTNPVSRTNGSTTLVAWVNQYSPYASTWSIYVRALDAPRPAWRITGYGPILATNGDQYLLAFSIAGSRFMAYPMDNVAVRLVSSDGTPGAARSLNRSTAGSAGGAAWNGEHWLVGYTSEGRAYVALLDSALDRITTAELGSGEVLDLAMIGRRAWAFVAKGGATEAIEIRPGGGIGARHSLADQMAGRVTVTTAGALVFPRLQNGVIAIPFDPGAGFGTARQVASDGNLRGAIPWEEGAAVLVSGTGGASIRALAPDGEVTATQALDTSLGIGLGERRDGLLYFEGREAAESGSDIYAYRLASLQVTGPAELISIANLAWQVAPVIATTEGGAIAFWREGSVNGPARVRSRPIDASGHPFGPIASLDAIPAIDDLSFDGERFFAVWASLQNEIYAAAISRDGAVAGAPMRLGEGSRPAIASSGGATLVVWRAPSAVLHGVTLRADASPAVPGGWPLLPAFGETESSPKITAIREGFLVGWTASDVRAIAVSPGGTVLRGVELGVPGYSLIDLASRGASALGLVAGPQGSLLYALDGEGRAFEAFDPHWDPWVPHSVTPIAENRYLVALARVYSGELLTSEVTMSGAFITGIGPLRRLGRGESVAVVGETPVALFIDDGVWVSTLPESDRRRAVARP